MTVESCNEDVDMELASSSTKKQQSKGFLLLAFALGMMCCNSSLVGGSGAHRQGALAQEPTEENMTVQKLLTTHSSGSNSPKNRQQMHQRFSSSFDIESKLTNMNIASREQSLNIPASEERPLNYTAKMMKSLHKGFNGPLSGLVKGLISGNQLHMTERMCQKANFFFWMSPNHCTLRLMRPTHSSSAQLH